MHHAFLYVWRKQLLLDIRLRLSACFLSCLLSRPQPAAALQRNTRPSTHVGPLPVYGQETPRPPPLPHYRAGKISFFCSPLPVETTSEFYNLINALKQLGTSKTMNKDFRCLKFISLSKIGKFHFLFFCLPSLSYYRICAFLWTQTKTFSCGTTAGNHELARCAHLARSQVQSYYRKLYKNKKE